MACDCEAKREEFKGKCNTPRVLQIESKEAPVLFHRIDVPASMGDDSDNPPLQGQYKNILLVYEANQHAYMFNSDGIYTQISWGAAGNDFNALENRPKYAGNLMTSATNIPNVTSAVAEEASARLAADTALENAISTETTERQANVADLSDAIDAEETAREQAVTAVSNDLEQEIADRAAADTALEDKIDAETTARTSADTSIETAINKVVVTDFSLNDTPSTTSIKLDGAKQNILTGATSSSTITLPVASGSQAGVMNSTTYQAIQSNAENINALLSGAVAVDNLPASPTQAQLTTAWQTATGLATLINRAQIFDQTNSKVWTYYTNASTWYSAGAGGSITVNTATNTSQGIVQGDATVDGKVFVESNGTMSLNGWDQVVDDVADALADVASLQTGKVDKVSGKGLSTEDYTTAEKDKLAGITVNNATLTIQRNGTDVQTFTANSSTDKTANIQCVTSTNVLDTQSVTPIVTTGLIVNEAVTADKIDFSTMNFGNYSTSEVDTGFTWVDGKKIYKKTINFGQLPDDLAKNVNHGIANLDYVIEINATAKTTSPYRFINIPYGASSDIYVLATDTYVQIEVSDDRSEFTECYVTLYYTKNS